jgi:hypothetical protein
MRLTLYIPQKKRPGQGQILTRTGEARESRAVWSRLWCSISCSVIDKGLQHEKAVGHCIRPPGTCRIT